MLTPGLSPVPVRLHVLSLSRLNPFEVIVPLLKQSAPASWFATMVAVRVRVAELNRPPPRLVLPPPVIVTPEIAAVTPGWTVMTRFVPSASIIVVGAPAPVRVRSSASTSGKVSPLAVS